MLIGMAMRGENKGGGVPLVSKIFLRSFLDRRNLLSVNEKTRQKAGFFGFVELATRGFER